MADSREIPDDGPEVIKILTNDLLFCKNWKLFCRALLQFEQSIMYDLEKMESSNYSITDIVIAILAHWKSTSTDYSLRILSEKLRETGCNVAAVKVDNLRKSGSTTKPSQIWFNVRSPTTHYSGRNEEMLAIEKQWKKCEESKTMMFVAVTGLGGIGKSEIAKTYAKTFYENVKGYCIWIDSETDQTLLQSLQELARDLKISILDGSGKEKNLNTLTEEIYENISNEKCLIIFDYMESYDNSTLRQLIDLASKEPPTFLKPLILITSRYRPAIKFFGDGKCLHLGLKVLSMESACRFFYKSFKLETPDSIPDNIIELIKKLCSRLQNYPLAMQQAAANIKETLFNNSTKDLKREIQNYLHEIEVRSKDFLDPQLPEIEAVDVNPTLMTWSITMSKIEEMPEVGKSAIRMMEIISFTASDNISIEFLREILGSMQEDRKDEVKTLYVLRDHSMISLSEQKVSIHRLVQEVTRIQLIEKGKWTDCLHALLTAIQKMLEDEEIAGDQMIQAETVWSHASTNTDLITKHQQLPTWICKNFERLGKYRELYNFSCVAVNIFGERSRWTLSLKYWKGSALENLGEYSEALVVLTEVHEKQKEFFGEEDDGFLDTCSLIGTVHWRLKNSEEALKWFIPALEIRERKFGNEHHGSLALKNNIALVLSAQGKYKEAKELHQQILEVRQRVDGLEHRETLSTKQNLAIVIYEQGEHEKALRMFQEVLEVRERVLEADHPLTLITKEWIADTYNCQGRMEEAIQLSWVVAEKREKVLGPQHPLTLQAKNNLEKYQQILITKQTVEQAAVSYKQGEYEVALKMFQEVLEVQKKVLKMNHPETLNTKGWIAHVCRSLGRREQSIRLAKEVWEKTLETLGPAHPQTYNAKMNFENYQRRSSTLEGSGGEERESTRTKTSTHSSGEEAAEL